MTINPNAVKNWCDGADLNDENIYHKFLKSVNFDNFKHIPKLEVNFSHPVTILTGSNKIGKSTILTAIACSHFDFQKRDPKNGTLVRQTWSSLMRFSPYDKQLSERTYALKYREGNKMVEKQGQRKMTKKWNGVAKKQGQILNRQAVYIDLDRLLPARSISDASLKLTKKSTLSNISPHTAKQEKIQEYLSYVFEENFSLQKIAQYIDKDIISYKADYEYSSYNAASGEEILTRILTDIVEAADNSLILIDEIEAGLHPNIQRRLLDVIYHISKTHRKQFILTTHSPHLLGILSPQSRIFIERGMRGDYRAISDISVNAAYSKMDSLSYPLCDVFVEDDESVKIIKKVIGSIQGTYNNFGDLINLIVVGSHADTAKCYELHKKTYHQKKIKVGIGCILDGDAKKHYSSLNSDANVFYIFGDRAPECFLVDSFLQHSSSIDAALAKKLKYHLENTNPHALFDKMRELGLAIDKLDAFDKCRHCFNASNAGKAYIKSLKEYLLNLCKSYSPFF